MSFSNVFPGHMMIIIKQPNNVWQKFEFILLFYPSYLISHKYFHNIG